MAATIACPTVGLPGFLRWVCTPRKTSAELYSLHERKAVNVANDICSHFYRSGALTHRKDIQNECLTALWVACEKYNPKKNDNFWLYAYLRVRGAAYDYLRAQRIIIKSGKPIYTALCFLSGDNQVSQAGSGNEHSAATWFEHMEGAVNSEAETGNVHARLDLAKVLGRSGLTPAENSVLFHYLQGEQVKEIAARLDLYQSRVSEALSAALEKVRVALPAEYSRDSVLHPRN